MMHFPVFDHVKIKEMGKVIVKLHQTEDQVHSLWKARMYARSKKQNKHKHNGEKGR